MNCSKTLNIPNFAFDISDPANCNNALCQGYAVAFHEITKNELDQMIRNHFNGSRPDPIKKECADIITTDTLCSKKIFFISDESSPNDNADLSVDLVDGPAFNGKYSVAYFKGILGLYNPTEFWFSKATCPDNNKKTVVFFATKDMNMNNVLYCGDLSGVLP